MSTSPDPSLSARIADERTRLAAGGFKSYVLAFETIATPIGELALGANETGLCSCKFEDDSRDDGPRQVFDGDPREILRPGAVDELPRQHLAAAITELREYLAGSRREFTVPLDPDFFKPNPFTRNCWVHLDTIPYGTTRSYGEVAKALGDSKASRAVGSANSRNPICIIRPCHRVIGADGSLTGFAGGMERKRWLLDHERQLAPTTPPTLFTPATPETP
jgi:methylated-DNA-[protein]-cysteine S-methyltransferase